ncbi:MAG: hypothetical protein AAFY71_09490 [Bacteroidota bacterium]
MRKKRGLGHASLSLPFHKTLKQSIDMNRKSIELPLHDPELTEIIEDTLQQREEAEKIETELSKKYQAERQKMLEEIKKDGPVSSFETGVASEPVLPKPFHHQQAFVDTPQHPVKNEAYYKAKTHEEILDKNTNYVFIFGYTGSGKSTVLTAINMYMRQHYRVILNQGENQEGIRLIHQMMRDVEEGSFPQPTSIGQITEYDTAFLMDGHDVNLTFLEMAGEDLKKVDVDTGEDGLPDSVKAYLTCPGVSISFLLVADFERVVARKEDKLILQFLSYLYNEGIDMSRVGVVLSKFDRGRTDMNVEEVIKTYLPQVDKWLTSGDIQQPRVFPFSIGEVKTENGRKDEIREIDLEDCQEVVPWIHNVLSLPGTQRHSQQASASKGFMNKLKNILKF